MRVFLQLPEIGRAVLLSAFLPVLIGLFFLVIARRIHHCRPTAYICPLLLLLLAGLGLVYLMEADKSLQVQSFTTAAARWVGGLPWAAHALLVLAAGLYGARALLREARVAGAQITPSSIREALDNLPSGICFSRANGIALLTNRKMYELADVLSGHRLRNVEELWQELADFDARNGIECVQSGDSPVFRLADGSVWRFTRVELAVDTEPYTQTTATDITRLYTLSEELSQSNAALHEQQKRLKSLLAQIVKIKREEEILAFKVKLHDELGRCVLAGRRILLQQGNGEGLEPVLALWRETVSKLETSISETDITWDDSLRQLMDAAQALGCAIDFQGELPKSREAAYLLLSAVREAVTNAVRHAQADRVTVQIREQGGMLAAHIADNGVSRPGPILEGGGLLNIRRRLERAGGALEILYKGGVQLHLRLPLPGEEV